MSLASPSWRRVAATANTRIRTAAARKAAWWAPGGGAGSGGNGVGDAGRGQTPVDGGVGGSNPFATCGGAIVDSRTGKVNAAEYGRQARLWDLW